MIDVTRNRVEEMPFEEALAGVSAALDYAYYDHGLVFCAEDSPLAFHWVAKELLLDPFSFNRTEVETIFALLQEHFKRR